MIIKSGLLYLLCVGCFLLGWILCALLTVNNLPPGRQDAAPTETEAPRGGN
jgi:hypothetical protein